VHFGVHCLLATKCISKLTRVQPPSAFSEFIHSWPLSASLHSLDDGLLVNLLRHKMTVWWNGCDPMPSGGNMLAIGVLAPGGSEEGEKVWKGTQPWGTTQIGWIYQRSAIVWEEPHIFAVCMKAQQECGGRRSRNDIVYISYIEIMSIYPGYLKYNLLITQSAPLRSIYSLALSRSRLSLLNWMVAVVRNEFSCHNGLQVHLFVLLIGDSSCSSDYT